MERSTESWDHGVVNLIVTTLDRKGTAIATIKVSSCWLGISTIVAGAVHGLIGDRTVDHASLRLGIDGEIVVGVMIPDLIDVVVPISAPGAIVDA